MKQNFQDLLRSLSSNDVGGDPNAKLHSLMSFLSGVKTADAQEEQMQQNPELAEQAQGNNVIMGGAGGDNIAQPQQPQSFNDILNATAAGKGNIDYDAFMKNMPTPRTSAAPATNQDAYDYMMSQGKDGESAGMTIGKAMAFQNAQKTAREGARNASLDARDLAAYNSAMGLSKESGNRQNEVGELDRKTKNDAADAEYQRGILRNQAAQLARGKYQPVQLKDGSYGYIDMNNPEGGVISIPDIGNPFKPTGGGRAAKTSISAADQGKINDAFDTIIGAKGIDRKPVAGVNPLDPELKKKLSAEAAELMLAGQAVSADDAALKVFKKYGGVNSLQEQTKPGMIWGTNKSGYRGFANSAPTATSVMGGGAKSNNDPFGFRD